MDIMLRELTQSLLQKLAPELTRPFPAMTLLELSGMTDAVSIPVGTSFQSTLDAEWQVQTTQSQTIVPVKFTSEMQGNEWHGIITATHACEFSLRELPFTILAPQAESQAWLHHLMTKTQSISLNSRRIHPKWKWSWRDPYSTILEFFHSPVVLTRFYCDSEQRIALSAGQSITFIVRTRTAFPPIPETAFHLHVIPAQLTQTVTADPIIVNPEEWDYPFTFSKPGQLYKVDSVVAKHFDGKSTILFPSEYAIHWDHDHITFTIINESLLTAKLFSSDIRICRESANWVRSAFVSRSSHIPHYIQARNITKPTRGITPPWHSGQGTEHAIVSGFMQSLTKLLNDNRLSEFLKQFQWGEAPSISLDVIRTSYRSIVDSGILYRIVRVECYAEDTSFQHRQEAWIFAHVLQYFLEYNLEFGMRAELILDWQNEQVSAP